MSAPIQTRVPNLHFLTNFRNIPENLSHRRRVQRRYRTRRAFQRQFNLTEDGLVGLATWYRIAFIYNNVKRLSELNSERLTFSEISRQYPERLTEGMSGPGVQLLQYLLAIVGEFYDALPRWQAGQIDGIFGPQTREAVAAYQRLVGLPITGVVDRETWYALLSTYRSVLLAQPEQEWLEQFIGLPETFLVKGMRGEAVRQAQQLINIIARGYAEVPAVTVDGIFGDATESSVSVIQSLLGLPTTGAIGPLDLGRHGRSRRKLQLAGSQSARGQYPAILLERRQRDCTPMHKTQPFSICRPFCGASSSLRAALLRSCRDGIFGLQTAAVREYQQQNWSVTGTLTSAHGNAIHATCRAYRRRCITCRRHSSRRRAMPPCQLGAKSPRCM